MKLSKATIRPGIVMEVLENGAIKASAPGLFAFVDDPNNMPPIIPWFIGDNSNAFSQPKVNDEVWVMNFIDNPRQLYWFRKDKISDNTNIPINEENVEVLCNREVNGEWCTIYFSDGSGWVIGKGESIIKIRPDGTIMLTNGDPNRCIDINGKNISIGSEGQSAHSAAYGDALEDLLTSLCSLLNEVGMAAMTNPYTMSIGTSLLRKLPKIVNQISNVSSQHVTID